MRKTIVALTGAVLLSAALGSAADKADKAAEASLVEKYRAWLELVTYIIAPKEKDVFLALQTDRDRDFFIEAFWKQRDPTPGTPENEYKDEHLKRVAYANKFYGRGTTRPGWKTDRGRFHIILGPPAGIERFEVSAHIVPCEGWSYYGDARKDLPAHFVLLFFQRGGVGEYKLYDPVADGPASLFVNKRDIDPTDYQDLYERLREMAPTLADISISLIPGEYNYDFSPSPRNSIIIADILESPRKDVSTTYATHFLDYKGVVSTEYLTNFVESEAAVAVIPDPLLGLPFIHFSVAPKTVSVDYYEPKERYYCNFRLDVSLRRGEAILFQYNREYTLYFSEEELARVRANGLSVEDCFPAAEGRYRMTILLQNVVGKEFTVVERDIEIAGEPAAPEIYGPFLGYRTEGYPLDIQLPFKILDRKLAVDPRNTFGGGDEVAFLFNLARFGEGLREGEVRVSVQGLREKAPVQRSYIVRLRDERPGRMLALGQTIPAGDLEPDYYRLGLTLVDGGGKVLDEATANFIVAPEKAIGHPVSNSKAVPAANQFLYVFMLANQYDKAGVDDKAEAFFERGLGMKPDYKNGALWYTQFLLKVGKFDRALETVERLKDDAQKGFEYALFRGLALMGKGLYPEAVESLQAANRIYNSDTRLLNALGACYEKTGRKAEARDAFRASLKLNPSQPEVQKLLAEVEKRP
jgi:GWxTD domain-containing protein